MATKLQSVSIFFALYISREINHKKNNPIVECLCSFLSFFRLENTKWMNLLKNWICVLMYTFSSNCMSALEIISLTLASSLYISCLMDCDYLKVNISMKYILFFSSVIRAIVKFSSQQCLHAILRNKTRTETVFTLIWASWITCYMSCRKYASRHKCALWPVSF